MITYFTIFFHPLDKKTAPQERPPATAVSRAPDPLRAAVDAGKGRAGAAKGRETPSASPKAPCCQTYLNAKAGGRPCFGATSRSEGMACAQRFTLAPLPFMMDSTSSTLAMLVSPGVVIASAPWAAP